MNGSRQRALVVGLGVTGMAAAVRLRRAGWEPVVVERAAERRRGGYFVGLFGTGRAAARRLGVLDTLHTRTPAVSNTWEVDRLGNREISVGFLDQPGTPDGVLRGDIEEALFAALDGVEIRFGTVPVAVRHLPQAAEVTLRETATGALRTERFDLVIGADGVRSTVRELVFAPAAQALRPLNRIICAFQLDAQVEHFAARDSIVLAEPDRSLWVFPFSDRPPTALFTFLVDDVDAAFRRPPAAVLRDVYGPPPYGAVLGEVLDQVERADNVLFDSVNQVRIPSWHRGRVVLMGDAAWCLTLYSGMGASTGMAGAVLLGDLLEAHGDVPTALRAWEGRMRPFVAHHQRWAYLLAEIFTPSGRVLHALRAAYMWFSAAGKRRPGNDLRPSGDLGHFERMRNLELVA